MTSGWFTMAPNRDSMLAFGPHGSPCPLLTVSCGQCVHQHGWGTTTLGSNSTTLSYTHTCSPIVGSTSRGCSPRTWHQEVRRCGSGGPGHPWASHSPHIRQLKGWAGGKTSCEAIGMTQPTFSVGTMSCLTLRAQVSTIPHGLGCTRPDPMARWQRI